MIINQVTIYVSDVVRSLEFYKNLGMKIKYPIHSDMQKYADEQFVTMDAGSCTFAIHAGGKENIGKDAPSFNILVEDISKYGGEPFSPVPGKLLLLMNDPDGNHFYLAQEN